MGAKLPLETQQCATALPRKRSLRLTLPASRSRIGSEIRLFGKKKGVVYLDPEITNRAFQFGVSKQKLASAQIAGSLIEERDLCAPEAVGAVRSGIEPD